jgi:hypothetical protein
MEVVTMANKSEYPEKYGWWINELGSLGVQVNEKMEENDLTQLEILTDDLKQNMIQKYKTCYSE